MLIGRYLPVLCFMGGVLSGTAQMARTRFLAYNAAGIILWATTQLLIAYYLGAGAKEDILGRTTDEFLTCRSRR